MIASIDPRYTGEITREEAAETMKLLKSGHYALPQFRGNLQGVEWYKQATSAQLQELLNYYQPILERELKALDDANRFRPSYAPAGRMTREQDTARICAQQTTRMVRMITYTYRSRAAKEQAA
jgi:hypothetical protein